MQHQFTVFALVGEPTTNNSRVCRDVAVVYWPSKEPVGTFTVSGRSPYLDRFGSREGNIDPMDLYSDCAVPASLKNVILRQASDEEIVTANATLEMPSMEAPASKENT